MASGGDISEGAKRSTRSTGWAAVAADLSPADRIHDEVSRLRSTFRSRKTRTYSWRVEQLRQLKRMTVEMEAKIFSALHDDLGKSSFESRLTETGAELTEIDHALRNLRQWMKPRKVGTPIASQPGYSEIVREPLGIVLIIAPWTYPFNLIVTPLIGAIAAGNCAVLKPSDLTPRTSSVLAEGISQYLDRDAICVIEGGVDETTALLGEQFDHIFFTGSPRVARLVMAAAAAQLTPVTLELGGKNPCIVGRDANLKTAAKRITWGKFVNAGQTCLAPDYCLVHKEVEDKFLSHISQSVAEMYGADPRYNADYPRIVNRHHFDRLVGLLDDGLAVVGGDYDRDTRYLAPTVLTDVSLFGELMSTEIFGPIFPVLSYSDFDEAVAFVNERPKPLAIYLFTRDGRLQENVVNETSSGGVCINDVMMHLTIPELPFGGIGASGTGAYHGNASFETFSHQKGVLIKSPNFELPLRYPPYTESKMKWLKRLT